jgi:hypothetical protein
VLRKYVDEVWQIPTTHFDPEAVRLARSRPRPAPLDEVLVQGSTYSRAKLKHRQYDEGLKSRQCEICGQGEEWRGSRISLILDHINGTPDDNRVDNLRIVCPNCAATLDTHCARKNRAHVEPRGCKRCGEPFVPKRPSQRYCSVECGRRSSGNREPQLERRKVRRPPHLQLVAELEADGFLAVGRKYDVSGNAVRKWLRAYESADATSNPQSGRAIA